MCSSRTRRNSGEKHHQERHKSKGRIRPGLGQLWAIPTGLGPSWTKHRLHPNKPSGPIPGTLNEQRSLFDSRPPCLSVCGPARAHLLRSPPCGVALGVPGRTCPGSARSSPGGRSIVCAVGISKGARMGSRASRPGTTAARPKDTSSLSHPVAPPAPSVGGSCRGGPGEAPRGLRQGAEEAPRPKCRKTQKRPRRGPEEAPRPQCEQKHEKWSLEGPLPTRGQQEASR